MWFQANVSSLSTASNCGRMAASKLKKQHSSFDKEAYELRQYEPIKNRSVGAILRAANHSDATVAGIVAHDLMQWVLESTQSNQTDRLTELKKCLTQITNSDFSHPLTQEYVKDLMPSSVHDARIQAIVERSYGLIRTWERFHRKIEIQSIQTERPLAKQLSSHDGTDVFLLARADAIVESNIGTLIIEFKTGNSDKQSEWIHQLELYAAICEEKISHLVIIHPNAGFIQSPSGIVLPDFSDMDEEESAGEHCHSCIHKKKSNCVTYLEWNQNQMTSILH